MQITDVQTELDEAVECTNAVLRRFEKTHAEQKLN